MVIGETLFFFICISQSFHQKYSKILCYFVFKAEFYMDIFYQHN